MPENHRLAREPRTLLQQLIWQREATYEEQVDEFMKLARQLKEPATVSVRHLQRLASGERSGERATPSLRRVMRQLYGHSFDELLDPPQPDPTFELVAAPQAADPRLLTVAAARDSLDFACWADADHVAPPAVEHVSYELTRIAVDYVCTPPLPLLQDLVALRDTMFGLVRNRPNPRQARELFFLTGTTCLLLAHASQNLGDSSSGMAQARTAWACAEQADHNGLRSWVCGTQALIAEWSRRPTEALAFARAGHNYAVTPDSRVRLAAIEARTLARVGDTCGAAAAVKRARRARDVSECGDELSGFGGLLTFPVAKQLYYAGSTFALIMNHREAQRAAMEAIGMYETGPPEQRSYGDEALARVDVATARLAASDLEGACYVLAPVLALPPAQRIQQLCDGLTRVQSVLALPRYGRAQDGLELAGQIEGFSIRATSGASVPSGP